MKSLAGQPELSNGMRVGSRRGLPLIVPGALRLQIEEGDVPSIRVVLTILSIYRVLKCKPQLKLESITKPFTGLSTILLENEIIQALRPLDYKLVRLNKNGRFLHTVKAGPNSKIAAQGGILDAYAFREYYPELLLDLKIVCEVTGMEVWNLLQKDLNYIPYFIKKLEKSSTNVAKKFISQLPDLRLGKLSKKLEAAGKVRIFAITDIWTQSALRPLNDYMFTILRSISQDGTHDQLGPLLALKAKGCQSLYSYDLSAATDRLPMALQVQVMSILKGQTFADAWKRLLVNRS